MDTERLVAFGNAMPSAHSQAKGAATHAHVQAPTNSHGAKSGSTVSQGSSNPPAKATTTLDTKHKAKQQAQQAASYPTVLPADSHKVAAGRQDALTGANSSSYQRLTWP